MTTLYCIYQFTRDQKTGFFRQNSGPTDALNVLIQWAHAGPGRGFEKLRETEDELVARVSFETRAQAAAALDMNRLCAEFAVHRELASY